MELMKGPAIRAKITNPPHDPVLVSCFLTKKLYHFGVAFTASSHQWCMPAAPARKFDWSDLGNLWQPESWGECYIVGEEDNK